MSATSIAEKFEVIADAVYDKGREDEYSDFWDIYQKNGERTNYSYGFANEYWTDDTFKPKYPFKLVGGGAYFMRTGGVVWADKTLELDTSEATNLTQGFYNCKLMNIGNLDIRKVTTGGIVQLFAYCYNLRNIGTITLNEDGLQTFDRVFYSCNALVDVTFDGSIGQNIEFAQSSYLNKRSITSVVTHLLKTAEGKKVTFKKSAVDTAFETGEGINDGSTSKEWIDLITEYSNQHDGNWTISLV